METYQDWLRNGSAHRVTLGRTVKGQVWPLSVACYVFLTGNLFHRQLQFKFGDVFRKHLEANGCSVIRVIRTFFEWYLFKGRTHPTGQCAAGFVCVGRASEPAPSDALTGFPCPSGFYCSVGTSVPKPCPKGTFRCMFCSMFVYYTYSLSTLPGTPY